MRHPIKAVIPTLDAVVLEALAGTTRPLSGLEIKRIAAEGSPNGVRRVLARLVTQGLVNAEDHPAATLYTANREHLTWPAVEVLVGVRQTLLARLRALLTRWRQQPIHASLYGSVARREGDVDSDIDILLVQPKGVDEDDPPWADQVDELRKMVTIWTGNRCQAFQITLERLSEHVAVSDPLVREWVRDSITLAGSDMRTVLRQLSKSDK